MKKHGKDVKIEGTIRKVKKDEFRIKLQTGRRKTIDIEKVEYVDTPDHQGLTVERKARDSPERSVFISYRYVDGSLFNVKDRFYLIKSTWE